MPAPQPFGIPPSGLRDTGLRFRCPAVRLSACNLVRTAPHRYLPEVMKKAGLVTRADYVNRLAGRGPDSHVDRQLRRLVAEAIAIPDEAPDWVLPLVRQGDDPVLIDRLRE